MSKALLDTDVLIDHMRGYRRLRTAGLAVSVVTRAELYAGSEREEPAVEALLAKLKEFQVNAAIARRAGRIQRTTGLKMADALIAATALEHDLHVMTRNRRHFERVPGLTLRDPDDHAESSADVASPAKPRPAADVEQPAS
jgi:tRNA(fMet)-specific endonuclease VapC